MSRRTRIGIFLTGAIGLAVVLGFALGGLPGFGGPLGRYAQVIADQAVPQRHATNTVIAIAFDYRALDTLVEEFIIFVAAVGATVLLRTQRDEREGEQVAERESQRARSTSDALRALGGALAPVVVLLALYVISHGQLTPGGGFQGGVVLAGAVVFVFVGGRSVATRQVRPVPALEAVEAAGAAGFALVGLGGVLFASAFLDNFIGLGMKGSLLSGGTIPVSNLAVGVEVAGAFVLVLSELLDQVVLVRRGER